MADNITPELQHSQEPQTKSYLEQHPSLAAIDATKQQNVNYVTNNTTQQNIAAKEQQLQSYFPTTNMEASQLSPMLKNIAKTDSNKWYSIQQLAHDIKDFYSKNKDLKKKKYPRSAGRAVNETINPFSNHIDDLYELADYITKYSLENKITGFDAVGGHINPNWLLSNPNTFNIGNDRVQNEATKAFDIFLNKTYPAIKTANPKQVVDLLHDIHDKHKYEYSIYANTNGAAKAASDKRLTSYEKAWNELQTRIAEFYDNHAQLYDFLTAYLQKPVTPVSAEDRKGILDYCKQLQIYVQSDRQLEMVDAISNLGK